MKQTTLRISDLMLLVGTRVALGVGIGLLVATRLDERARKGAGVALLVVGVLTTVPLALNLRAGSRGREGAESAAEHRARELRASMGVGSEGYATGASPAP